jgi:hypothetical protein
MITKRHVRFLVGAALAVVAAVGVARAGLYYRQYYSSWNYYPQYNYYYSNYYYQPTSDYQGYNYHYCIYYPSYPNYVYYYNPYRHTYWGRLDLKGKPGHQYSLLADKDRKEKLKDIPETAFPTPGKMPPIPESKDGAAMEPVKDLPKITSDSGPGKDLPGPEK